MSVANILVNLGRPCEYTRKGCGKFMREFLGDPCVLSLPNPLRALLAYGIASKRAEHYMDNLLSISDSPYEHPVFKYSKSIASQIAKITGEPCRAAFRYGDESIEEVFRWAKSEGADVVKVVPMYPQDAYSTTESAYRASCVAAKRLGLKMSFCRSYFDDSNYIEMLAKSVSESVKENESLLASFHSVPISHLRRTPYFEQCSATVDLLSKRLGGASIAIAWQSRAGGGKWLGPSALDFAENFDGKKLAVLCPGFSCDCTETLLEIGEELKAEFVARGGKIFTMIPCLNDSSAHVRMFIDIFERLK